MKKKILHLSLKRLPFEVMVTGEKITEYRDSSNWIKSRLFDKELIPKKYDFVKFVNGYGSDKPFFICEFLESRLSFSKVDREYSNGLRVSIDWNKEHYRIELGDIVEIGNYTKETP